MSNVKIASAVAGVLAACAASASFAAATTPAAAAAGIPYWMGGSSAAISGFGSAIGADLCAGGASGLTLFTTNPSTAPTGTPDFRALSCVAASGKPNAGSQVTIYYRAEGGSVVGAFGPLNKLSINELDLTKVTCAAAVQQSDTSWQANCTGVVGTSGPAGNSPDDSFSGAVQKKVIEVGISDLEPGAFGNALGSQFAGNGNNDPAGVYSFIGADATPDQLQGQPHSPLFQQSFGFVANKTIGATDISSAAAAAIMARTVTDWSQVSNSAGVAYAAAPIHICNRDLGSGTRTAADVYLEQDGCNTVGTTTSLIDPGTNPDSFSTGDLLACVNGDASAIGYVSTDNNSKAGSAAYPNVVALTLDGRTASTALSASGGWPFLFEASAQKNNTAIAANGSTAFYNYLIPALQALATAPQSAQVTAIPGLNGNHHGGGSLVKNAKIYVSNFTRGANSCTPLTAQ